MNRKFAIFGAAALALAVAACDEAPEDPTGGENTEQVGEPGYEQQEELNEY